MHNVIIIGSGPAAHTAAVYTARANLEPLLFEGELSQDILPGGQLMTTTDVENYPGFPEGISGPEMMERFRQQSVRFGTRIEPRTVSAVDLSRRPFTVRAESDAWQTRALIIATGAMAKWLGLPSEEVYMNRGVSACATCDGALPRFRGKVLVVVGGGDTAMEEALFLTTFASRVHVVHRRDQFRASRIMGDRVKAHPKITVEWHSVAEEVLGNEKQGVTGVRIRDVHTGATREIEAAGYFAAIGHKPNSDLFAGVLEMDEQGYIRTKAGSSYTNVEGVFAAGDVQDRVYRQAITAAGSGCMAALDCTRWLEAQNGHA